MDALKKIPLPWIVVGLISLVVIMMVFQQRRSGYTPSVGAPMTMMDLQEFSAFTPDQKAKYNKLLADAMVSEFPSAAASNSITTYQKSLNNILTMAMAPSASQPSASQPSGALCPFREFSPNGKMPCNPCPENTYCPMEGMIYPMECPTNTRSPPGSRNISDCTPTAPMNPTAPMR